VWRSPSGAFLVDHQADRGELRRPVAQKDPQLLGHSLGMARQEAEPSPPAPTGHPQLAFDRG
jgi:hypothetical protein